MSSSIVLKVYKQMLRESQKFTSYNYRCYALRKIRDSFKDNKNLTDTEKITNVLNEANRNLDIIKRQVVIGEMYQTSKLIIETTVRNK